MTAQAMRRYLCDAPGCPAATMPSLEVTLPADWTEVESAPPRTLGRFALHLCPAHADWLAGHQPGTVAGPLDGGVPRVRVTCSCGALDRVVLGYVAPGGPEPRYVPERVWWEHLPLELRGRAPLAGGVAGEPHHHGWEQP